MKVYCVIAPTGEILKTTAANSKAHVKRLFLKLPRASLAEVNRAWTSFRREGYDMQEQLQLSFLANDWKGE